MYTSFNAGALGITADLREAAQLAQQHGFTGLDFSIEEAARLVGDTSLDEVRSIFSSAGLHPGAWGLPIPILGSDSDYTAALQRFSQLASVAAQLGATRCSTWILPFSKERSFTENEELHIARLRPAAEILASHGCRLGLEFIGPATMRRDQPHEFIHTMDGMLALSSKIGTGNVSLLLDCWHWYTAHGTVAELRRLTNADVVYVHVNDAPAGIPVDSQIDQVRTLPGATGVIDITGFLQALQQIGYDGPVAVEPFDTSLNQYAPDERVARAAAALRQVWKDAGLPQ